jgi:hypothetical protein
MVPGARLARGVDGEGDAGPQLDAPARRQGETVELEHLGRRAARLDEVDRDVDEELLRATRGAAQGEADGDLAADAHARRVEDDILDATEGFLPKPRRRRA